MGKAPAAEAGHGLRNYYKGKIEELELQIKDRSHNLRRLEAQRNELNTQGTVSLVPPNQRLLCMLTLRCYM